MAVLSVDLAHNAYRDIGAVILRSEDERISCRIVQVDLVGVPSPEVLAHELDTISRIEGIKEILLDGPQAWKSADNGLLHSRKCERELNTPGKTGLPYQAKPAAYLPFISFSIATFDALSAMGWQRFLGADGIQCGPVLFESFPYSAWRHLGLKPLPSKRRARQSDIEAGLQSIQTLVELMVDATPNHDQLQAIVSGLAGLAFSKGDLAACSFAGTAPSVEDGFWREGWIVNRKRP